MIIKVFPDKERAESMLLMAQATEETIKEIIEKIGLEKAQNMIAREYYEAIRELVSAILLTEGLKASGEYAHKEIIDYLSNYKEFSQEEINELQDLRDRRNKSSYEGKLIKSPYLENKKEKLDSIIDKLKSKLKKKLRLKK